MTREDFTKNTVGKIAANAMFICANDQCLRFTGYVTTEGKARRLADAAHIAPASPKGPGANTRKTATPRSDAANGVWLCKICHKKVDDDPSCYPDDLLRRWKNDQEEVVRGLVGKDIEAALLALRSAKRYHTEMRELLAYLDDLRVFDEGLDHEFPAYVYESLELVRARIQQVRAKLEPKTELFTVLGRVQTGIREFYRAIGFDTDLRVLRCDGGDPKWIKFSEELLRLRREMNILLGPLAQAASFPLRWLRDAADPQL